MEAGTASDVEIEIEILEAAIFKAAGEDDDGHELYDPVYYKPGTGDARLPVVPTVSNSKVAVNLTSLGQTPYCLPIYFKGLTSPKDVRIRIEPKTGNRTFAAREVLRRITTRSHPSPVSWAVRHSWLPVLKRTGEWLGPQGLAGRTTLSWAAVNGNIDVIKHLQTAQGEIFQQSLERKDEKGRTPLSLAAGNGREDVVRLLVGAGADIRSEDNQQISPLIWASMNHCPRMEAERKTTNCDTNENSGEMPWSQATRQESPSDMPNYGVVAYLMEQWRNLNPPHPYWELKHLHQASRCGLADAVKTLLSLQVTAVDGVIPSTGTEKNKTALCIAAERGHCETVESLLTYKADVNYSIPKFGDTPLLLAMNGEVNEVLKAAVVDVLLEKGANPFAKNANEETAEYLAVKKGLQSVATRVLQRSKEGTSAERADQLDKGVDKQFSATVVTFKNNGDNWSDWFRRQPSLISLGTLVTQLRR
ncbi:ankyrin repeat domain-containing protein [Fusarium austroafricanum]|uniref:Ankyrin repeat domain-containing protein n=1 Tax=Fusarium austroafricanum TaxID=2364996 RepID=A0A8H4K0N2_9HYPO|nr:ankyrin repeat domain-containing protein [Fusarium austroafricanum]